MPEVSEATRAPHRTSGLAERLGLRYVLWFFAIPVLAYVLPFAAQKIVPLEALSETRWDGILDYGYNLQGQNADIVIFGDSTATHNIDAVRLSRELGMKVINIPANMPSLPILEDSRLRRYLANNRPPRLIVFHFARWEMDFNHEVPGDTFDGVQQVIRHDSLARFMEVARRHPANVLEFPFEFYKASTRMTSLSAWSLKAPVIQQGFTPFQIRNMSGLGAGCLVPEHMLAYRRSDSVRQMVEAFTSDRTRTLVYTNPLPGCENVTLSSETGVGGTFTAVLPPDHFAKDGSYAHMLPDYTAESTDLLSHAIRRQLLP